MMRLARTVPLLVAVLASDPFMSRALGDSASERETLRGVSAIRVVVGTLDPQAERDGLRQSTLQTDIELKLRQAGIPVVDTAGTEPFLNVVVHAVALERPSGLYAYTIHVQFFQVVVLRRDRNIPALGATWSGQLTTGTVGADNLSAVRSSVRDRVDEFVNAYLAANPK
jgi:hypothetical protein